MLSLSHCRRPAFASANAVSFLMYAGLFGALFLMDGFTSAIWVAVAFSAAGVVAAALGGVRRPQRSLSRSAMAGAG
jgi:hypothetical protein